MIAGKPYRAPRDTLPAIKETTEQEQLFTWSRMMRGKYPELALLFHAANTGGLAMGYKNAAPMVAALRRRGVKTGVPDVWLPLPRHGYAGAVLELKKKLPANRSKDASSEPTDEQQWWLAELERQGWFVGWRRGFEEARDFFVDYLEGRCGRGPFRRL